MAPFIARHGKLAVHPTPRLAAPASPPFTQLPATEFAQHGASLFLVLGEIRPPRHLLEQTLTATTIPAPSYILPAMRCRPNASRRALPAGRTRFRSPPSRRDSGRSHPSRLPISSKWNPLIVLFLFLQVLSPQVP